MSLLLRNIAGYAAQNGLGTVGSDIFVGEMPADPANAILFAPVVSPPPSQYLDTQNLDFEVWSRNESTKTGGDKLTQFFTLMHRFHHLTLGDYHLYFIEALGNIENMGRDTENRKLQKINFRAIYKDTRTVS